MFLFVDTEFIDSSSVSFYAGRLFMSKVSLSTMTAVRISGIFTVIVLLFIFLLVIPCKMFVFFRRFFTSVHMLHVITVYVFFVTKINVLIVRLNWFDLRSCRFRFWLCIVFKVHDCRGIVPSEVLPLELIELYHYI